MLWTLLILQTCFYRRKLTQAVAFKYRVHNTGNGIFQPEDGPAPGSPHPTGAPNGFQAPTVAQKLIAIESLLPGKPWLPQNAKTTKGNNCFAYADLKSPMDSAPAMLSERLQALESSITFMTTANQQARQRTFRPALSVCSFTSIGFTTDGTRPVSMRPQGTVSRITLGWEGSAAILFLLKETTSAALTTRTWPPRRWRQPAYANV
mgnify:CR=1 FL=1